MSKSVLAALEPSRGLSRHQKEAIVRAYMPVVRRVVLRLSRKVKNLDVAETLNAGLIGIADALEKFDSSFEGTFENYARYRVREAILESLKSNQWAPVSLMKQNRRIESAQYEFEKKYQRPPTEPELAQELGMSVETLSRLKMRIAGLNTVSLEELASKEFSSNEEDFKETSPVLSPTAAGRNQDPLASLLGNEVNVLLSRAVERLSVKERQVITLYYRKEMNLKEVGRQLGVTESRASQIRSKALRKLRHYLHEVFV
jgi:RNA polymerase sigma factor FliA